VQIVKTRDEDAELEHLRLDLKGYLDEEAAESRFKLAVARLAKCTEKISGSKKKSLSSEQK
jgi:hypothetical protein